MSDEKSAKKKSLPLLDKLKGIKHIEIIIAVIFGLILILIYMSGVTDELTVTTTDNTVEGYVTRQEEKLEEVLSNINGASNVSVVITLDMEDVQVDETTGELLMNTFPSIKGVVIVAGGVDNVEVKLNIIKAAQALFGLSSSSVEVFLSN